MFALVSLFVGGRVLLGRAIALSTDGATVWWRAPFARVARPVNDLRIVKCNRARLSYLGGAIGGLGAAIGHGRNHSSSSETASGPSTSSPDLASVPL